jgi:mRNA interferase MazF
MVSSQRKHFIAGFDEIVETGDGDFAATGLKTASIIRTGRLAVVEGSLLRGAVGQISADRLKRLKLRLATWLTP